MTSETIAVVLVGYGRVTGLILLVNLAGWADARRHSTRRTEVGTTAIQHARWVFAAPLWPVALLYFFARRGDRADHPGCTDQEKAAWIVAAPREHALKG